MTMTMTAEEVSPAGAKGRVRESQPVRLVCSEIWGGNQPILTPIELPGVRGMLFSHACDGGRGGDVHYLSVCGTGLLSRMCLADVVGHGETVAAVSGEMHTHLRRCMNTPDQRRVLRKLNRRLERLGLKAMTTAALATYYAPTRRLTVSYAGHPPGWLYRRSQRRWSRLALDQPAEETGSMTDMPLAVWDDVSYSRKAVRVAEGDQLILLTDGVLEALDADGRQLGDDRIGALLEQHSQASCDQIMEAVLTSLCEHVGNCELSHDDVSLLVVEFGPGPSSPALWMAVKHRIMRPRGNSGSV